MGGSLEGAPHLDEAKAHLERAWGLHKGDGKQFLIPVTLAEVLSYRDNDRAEAGQLFQDLVSRLSALTGLDTNQRALFTRCDLLRGNLAVRDNNPDEAQRAYHTAKTRDPSNPFVELSLLLCKEKLTPARAEEWALALNLLLSSGVMEKKETISRVSYWSCRDERRRLGMHKPSPM